MTDDPTALPSVCLTPGAIYSVHADHQGHVFLCVTLPRSIDHDLIKNYTSGRFAVADGDNSYAALRASQEKMHTERRRINKLFHDALEPLIGNIYRAVWPLGIAGRTVDGETMPPTYDEYLAGGVGSKLAHLLKNAPRDGTYIEVSIGAAVIHNVYWCDEASEWAQDGRTFYPKLPETATWQYMTKPVVQGGGAHREEVNNGSK